MFPKPSRGRMFGDRPAGPAAMMTGTGMVQQMIKFIIKGLASLIIIEIAARTAKSQVLWNDVL